MYKNFILLIVLVIFTCSCQHIMASDNRKESQQRPGTSDSRSASQQITKTSDASARTHSLKPSGLLLKVDFEDEEVKPLKKKEDTYDQLVLYTPKGQRSAVGIMYQGGNNNDRRLIRLIKIIRYFITG